MRLYGNGTTKCPALVYHDERWWCGIIEGLREPLLAGYKREMSIGAGCSSTMFNGDREKIPAPEECGWPVQETPEQVDWRKVFVELCRAIGSEWISGDSLYLIARKLEHAVSRDVAREFLHHVREHQDSKIAGFMGRIPKGEKSV